MPTVAQVLDVKGSAVATTEPEATVFEAAAKLAADDIGCLVVTRGRQVVGIFSERDIARGTHKLGEGICRATVADLMTPRVMVVDRRKTIEECMSLMTAKHVRHLPVLVGDELVGVISIGDVVKSVMTDQEATIGQLERYIQGS